MTQYSSYLFFGLMLLLGFAQAQEKQPDKSAIRAEKRAVKKAEKAELKAQTQRYLVLGGHGRYGVVQDLRLSPLRYSGMGGGVNMGERKITPKALTVFDLMISYAGISPAHGQTSVENYYGDVVLSYLRDMGAIGNRPWRWYLGGATSGMSNLRINESLGNSSVAWESTGMLGASAALIGEVELPLIKRPVQLDYQLTVPLVAYVNRGPAYSLPGFDPFVHYIMPIGRLTRLNSQFGMSFPLSKGNQNLIRLSYNWDFYAYPDQEVHSVRSANHLLKFELLINL